ncbi:MAG: DUF4268 domain-containing protein [Myxococcota bacterium]
MKQLPYATPLLQLGDEVEALERLEGRAYDERFVQELAFAHPACLPVAAIDPAFEQLVPVCMELRTPAGPLDALYVTSRGRLVVLEAKLWRNPEARRKVVAQILDYAKELARWSYEDLQRAVNRALGRTGNTLYELVLEAYPEVDEARFVDEVQRSLERGRFLLLIVGDGIQRGAASITSFLDAVGNLELTFGLVELGLYRTSAGATLVLPRVLARTVEIGRYVVQLPEGATLTQGPTEVGADDPVSDDAAFYEGFWKELLAELALEDPSQPLANATRSQNIYFPLPPKLSTAWVSAYFSQSSRRIGVYVGFTGKGSFAELAAGRLESEREAIAAEVGETLHYGDARHPLGLRMSVQDIFDPDVRASMKAFFTHSINRLVSAIRPRLEALADELE